MAASLLKPTRTHVSVLIVEDNPVQVDLLEEFLEQAQSQHLTVATRSASTVADAVFELAKEPAPDVILLDLNLPDSRSLEGLGQIHRFRDDVPIIILTNVDDEELALEAGRKGAFDYLLKHEISSRLLMRTIRYAMYQTSAERALRESEERYALAVAGAHDGIWDWVVGEETIYLSATMREMFGFDAGNDGSLTLDQCFACIDPRDVATLKSSIMSHIKGLTAHFEQEVRITRGPQTTAWMLLRGLAVRGQGGRAYRMAGSLTDVTERKQAEARLLHGALHDALTDLPNRALLIDRLNQTIRRYGRDDSSGYAVMYFDLDRFKSVNDNLGHAIGDELLVSVARRISTSLRPDDTLARLSGDEFAVLLGHVSGRKDTDNVAQRVAELLEQPFQVSGHEVKVAVSIGAVLGNETYKRPEDLLRDADLAMYAAKADANLSYKLFDEEMRHSADAQHRLESDLRSAVERGELVAHYQPIVALDSSRIQGFEALMRWDHPRHGLLHPESFMHVAEETGLIVPMSWWMLEEALSQLKRWQVMFPLNNPLTMSINTSGKLFAQPGVLQRMSDLLDRVQPAPSSVHLEITETTALEQSSSVLSVLDGVRSLGMRLDIDDFGTGYASLTYLQRFCYDTLKIDRSFVSNMVQHEDSGTIVKALVKLAESLGMSVIAEGVESEEQLHWLRKLKCQQAQGYLFSQPVGAAEMAQQLTASNSGRFSLH